MLELNKQFQIDLLKKKLADTDYKAIKYAETEESKKNYNRGVNYGYFFARFWKN